MRRVGAAFGGLKMRGLASRFAVASTACFLVAGCAVTDHFDGRVATFDIATEQARDQMIFTNIIRASRAEPLAFFELGQVSGSNSTASQLGLPSLVIGPQAPAVNGASNISSAAAASHFLDPQMVFGANPAASGFASNSISTSGSTSFNITPAETKDFYRGLLLPVEPETLAAFIEQGIANEMLFYLFTEKIAKVSSGVVTVYTNDPLDANFKEFQRYVGLATAYHLISEPEPGSKPPKAASSDKSKKSNSSSADNPPPQVWRLCFDRSAWAPGTKFADNHPMCGSKEKMKDPREVNFLDGTGKRVEMRVFPRSTFSIFQYLGRIVAAGDAGAVTLRTPEAVGTPPLQDDTLFAVNSGVGIAGDDCFLSVAYGGRGYCVPNSAFNTKRILGLIAQLLALNTSIQDVGITQQVQLLPQ